MAGQESVLERRLRAACDRCHELKNRCMRTGGPESRCSRCDRLDIDCVYRNVSRMGRPRAQKSKPAQQSFPGVVSTHGSRENYTLKSSSRSSQVPMGGILPPVATELMDNANGFEEMMKTSDGDTLEQSPEIMDLFRLAEEGTEQHADMEWSLDLSHHAGVNLSLHDLDCQDTMRMVPSPPSPELFTSPDSGRVIPTSTTSVDTSTIITAGEQGSSFHNLFKLQYQLHGLLSEKDWDRAIDYVDASLEVTKLFLEILQRYCACTAVHSTNRLPVSAQGDITHVKIAVESQECSGAEPVARQGGQQAYMSYTMLLQILTCYSYTLPVLDRAVVKLQDQSGKPPSVKLGSFNLASQPALNNEVVLYSVLRMVQSMRILIHGLVSGLKGSHAAAVNEAAAPPPADQPNSDLIVNSLHAIAHTMQKKEKALIERLSLRGDSRGFDKHGVAAGL